jgi:hypothetical protein
VLTATEWNGLELWSVGVKWRGLMVQGVRAAGDTADIETGQFVIMKALCVLLPSVITNVSISAFSPIIRSIFIYMS